jgi:hypothetical protein
MLDKNDYELLDYLMAWMALDTKTFAANAFMVDAMLYLRGKYNEDFIPIGRQMFIQYMGANKC